MLDWPAMRGTVPGLAAIIFLLAFTSFPIVLLLGGGPAVQTLELAIYSAVRLDFDLDAAVTLALVQIGALRRDHPRRAPRSHRSPRASTSRRTPAGAIAGVARLLQWLVLALALLGFAAPAGGRPARRPSRACRAILASPVSGTPPRTSLWIAFASSLLSLALAPARRAARAATDIRWLRVALGAPAYAYLAVPAVALSLGAFLFVRNLGLPPERAAPVVLVIANALLTLPFAIATLGTAARRHRPHARAGSIRSLGLGGTRQFFWSNGR